jgi:acyl phosphate:glycerol-3-phosphate acyltransferase
MQFVFVAVMGYLLGSIPWGFIVVRASTGRDVRKAGSGRTGGTNVGRAAGVAAGIITTFLDGLKGAVAVWLAEYLIAGPSEPWAMALAGVCAILGHNYPLFLRFKGGAGGSPMTGVAVAIWPWSILFTVPIAALIFYFVGYASVTTLSAAVIVTVVFAVRLLAFHAPGAHVAFIVYGLVSLGLLALALRPNLLRLARGQERLVGWRAKRQADASRATPGDPPTDVLSPRPPTQPG